MSTDTLRTAVIETVKHSPAIVIQKAARAGAGTASIFADRSEYRVIDVSGLLMPVDVLATGKGLPVLNDVVDGV